MIHGEPAKTIIPIRIAVVRGASGTSREVIIVVGDNEQTAREAYAENHLGDRSDLRLVGQQEDLVRAVLDAGKPTVLVLFNGRTPRSWSWPSAPRPSSSAGTRGRRLAPQWRRCSSAT